MVQMHRAPRLAYNKEYRAGHAAPPVFDGLIAAYGALFVAQTDGKLVCLE